MNSNKNRSNTDFPTPELLSISDNLKYAIIGNGNIEERFLIIGFRTVDTSIFCDVKKIPDENSCDEDFCDTDFDDENSYYSIRVPHLCLCPFLESILSGIMHFDNIKIVDTFNEFILKSQKSS